MPIEFRAAPEGMAFMNRFTRLSAILLPAALIGCQGEPRGPLRAGGREVSAWVAEIHAKDPKMRRLAVLKLGNVGDADPAAAPAIAEALRDADAQVRHDAILAAFKLTKPSSTILAELESMSRNDKDARVKDAAGRALSGLQARR